MANQVLPSKREKEFNPPELLRIFCSTACNQTCQHASITGNSYWKTFPFNESYESNACD